jgi:hypothetical protein
MKRIFYITAIIAGIAIIVLVGYVFRYKGGASNPETSNPTVNLGELPSDTTTGSQTGSGSATNNGGTGGTSADAEGDVSSTSTGVFPDAEKRFGVLIDRPVVAYFIQPTSSEALFVETNGAVGKLTKDGFESLSASPIENVLRASFSFDGEKVLLTTGTRDAERSSVFDVENKTWSLLPEDVDNPVWSPIDYRIAYVRNVSGIAQVVITDIGSTSLKTTLLASLALQDLGVSWPASGKILLADKNSARIQSSSWTLDISTKSLAPFMQDEYGLSILMNGTASEAVAFTGTSAGKGGLLTLRGSSGATEKYFSFLTLPTKCTFGFATSSLDTAVASSSVIVTHPLVCATPLVASTFSNGALPDVYDKKAVFTSDYFYKADASTGAINRFDIPDGTKVDASMLTFWGDRLYFVNRADMKVYFFNLISPTYAD